MPREPARGRRRGVPKLCAADVELGNFVLGLERLTGTGYEASRALLREIEAPYAERVAYGTGGYVYNPQDWGRKYLASNGGCVYIDLDHLEICQPEVLGAYDHLAAWHAMLRIARHALDAANARLPPGQTIHVLVNNSDGRGNSYGSHLNFLVTRRAWDNIFERKLHHLLYLAAFQISSIVFTGQGKVGVENGRPAVRYQLSQRADFFEALTGVQTTYRRPIVNSRDEPLCGPQEATPASALARLHCIFFDSTLCHGSSLLKVGVMQLVLAMIEAEEIDPGLILDDPVATVVRWSHDPTLEARARMASGKVLTAVELQLLFLERAERFAATGGFDGIVPRAADILALWADTLEKLCAKDLPALAGRLDWIRKLFTLERALERRPDLGWDAPAIKHLDFLYASLDRDAGLYWAHERRGDVERLVSEAEIERFVHEPPDDTRAWTRAMLLRIAGARGVQDVDWDAIRFRKVVPGYWTRSRTLRLDDPLAFTKAAVADVIGGAATLDDILDALEASPPVSESTPSLYEWGKESADTGGARAGLGTGGDGGHWTV
jgi:proteasome accessory factor A